MADIINPTEYQEGTIIRGVIVNQKNLFLIYYFV
jgi:hypothetical protein